MFARCISTCRLTWDEIDPIKLLNFVWLCAFGKQHPYNPWCIVSTELKSNFTWSTYFSVVRIKWWLCGISMPRSGFLFFKGIQWDMQWKGRWLVPRNPQIINNKVEKLVDVTHKKHNRYVVFWTPFNSTQNRTVFFSFSFVPSMADTRVAKKFIRGKFNAQLCKAIFYKCRKNFFCLDLSSFGMAEINVIDLLRLNATPRPMKDMFSRAKG